MPNWEKFQLFPSHLGTAMRASAEACPFSRLHCTPRRADKVNKTLAVQESLLGLPDNSSTTTQHRAKEGRPRRLGSGHQKVWPNWGLKDFPEYRTLGLRHKSDRGVASGHWGCVPEAISEKKVSLGVRAHAPPPRCHSLAVCHLPRFLHWHSLCCEDLWG